MHKRGGIRIHLSPEIWRQVELACVAGMSYEEAARQFGIKPNTVRVKAARDNWPTPAAVAKRAKELATTPDSRIALDKIAGTWQEKAESHRLTVFEKTSKAIANSTVKPPDNWHDFDIADKAARRSAGLENSEVVQQTLVNINDTKEAEIIDLNSKA